MIIIHVVEAYEGGVIEFINSLTKNLSYHKHYIIFSERAGDIKVSYDANVTFIKWPHAQREISPFNDIRAIFSLYKIIRGFDYDAIHLHSSKAGILGRIIAPFLANKNIIYSPNGAAFNRLDVSSKARLLFRTIEKIANWFGGKVVSVSESEARDYSRIGIKGFYINNGVSITNEIEQKNLEGKLSIGTIGRLTPQKNPTLFNEIAMHFVDNPKVEFLWIGGGELNNAINSPNVKVTGWLPKEDAVKNLRNIDIYLSTALWEGLPFAVLDAMNFKKALILNKCTGNVDLVKDNGYLYSSANEAIQMLDLLINDPSKILSMGLKSYGLLKSDFSAKQMAKEYEYAYLGQFDKLKKP